MSKKERCKHCPHARQSDHIEAVKGIPAHCRRCRGGKALHRWELAEEVAA